MLDWLRKLYRNLPTLILAIFLALSVWVSAVTEADPKEEKQYPQDIPLEIIGQGTDLAITNEIPDSLTLRLAAPMSIWEQILNEPVSIRAILDLSGLETGTYIVPVQVQVGIRPIEIVSYSPSEVSISLEPYASKSLNIHLVTKGELAVGFQADDPILDPAQVTISGPASQVNSVQSVIANLDISNVSESMNKDVDLQAVDADGNIVEGVNLGSEVTKVTMVINQLGGYRNVVVKVVVNNQVASGYRVTNISVFPPAVTVFSTDPKLVENLPGYVETVGLDLSDAKDDLDVALSLNLPAGVSVIGDQTVEVQVGIAAIEGSLTLEDMPIEIIGLPEGFEASISPEVVDVILSGPLPLLDELMAEDVHVFIDLTDDIEGVYQRVPEVELTIEEITNESVLPGSIEVTITKSSAS